MTFPAREDSIEPRPAILDGPATAAVSCDPADSCYAGWQVVPRTWGREQHAACHSNNDINITHITFRDDTYIHASAHTKVVSTTKWATCDVICDSSRNPARDANPRHQPRCLQRRLL